MHFHNKRYETRYGAKKYAEGKEENSIYAVRGVCHDGKRKEYQREKKKEKSSRASTHQREFASQVSYESLADRKKLRSDKNISTEQSYSLEYSLHAPMREISA